MSMALLIGRVTPNGAKLLRDPAAIRYRAAERTISVHVRLAVSEAGDGSAALALHQNVKN
jgi:hypothetical protein